VPIEVFSKTELKEGSKKLKIKIEPDLIVLAFFT
jgi:hypothetical protein